MQKAAKTVTTGGCCPTGSGGESREISLLGSGAHAVSVPCCPIEIGKIEEAEAVAYDAANEGKQARKTVRPPALESEEAKEDVEQQGGPELPSDGEK